MKSYVQNVTAAITVMLILLPNVSNSALLGDFNNDGVVSISEVQTCINSFLGISLNVFTTAMVSGKNFDFVSSDSSGSITFNADLTLSATHSAASGGGTTGGTWSINSSGQLINTFTADGGTYTSTLTSATATSISVNQTWTKPSGDGSGTMTFNTPTSVAFTTTMLQGKTATLKEKNGNYPYKFSSTGNTVQIDFLSNGGIQNGTWTIDATGKLTVSIPGVPAGSAYPSTFQLKSVSGKTLYVTFSQSDTPTLIEGPTTFTLN